MNTRVMILAIAAFFASSVLASPIQDTALANKDNSGNVFTRQTIQWPQNEVEVCTDAHYQGTCQKKPQYINVCWPLTGVFSNSISSIRFEPSETDTAGAMSCSFFETGDCSFVFNDGTKRPVLNLLGPVEDLSSTQFNDKLQSVKCIRAPKQSPKTKKSEKIAKRDDLLQ